MRQRVVHGAFVDFVTPDELYKAIPRPRQLTRIRVPGSLQLTAAGGGAEDIYKVPNGMTFEIRRIVASLSGNVPSDPNTGNVLLNVAGKWLALLRSGSLIEYMAPVYGSAIQVPGTQTWGAEQGPFLANGEVLGIAVNGLTANAVLSTYVEGILTRPEEH